MLETKARNHLEDILNREEYQAYYKDNRSIWQILYDWVRDLFQKLLEKLFPALSSTPNLSGFIVTILILVLVLVLILIMFKLWQRRKYRKGYEQSIPLANIDELKWTYQTHFDKAKEEEKQGNYKQSIRHLFLGLLLFYNEIDWLEAKAWKTNWEYYRELKKQRSKAASSFNTLAISFDAVAYGRKKVSEAEFLEFKKAVSIAYEEAKRESMGEGE